MGYRRRIVGFCFFVAAIWIPIHAEEQSVLFEVTPPPIGYPQIKDGLQMGTAGLQGIYLEKDIIDTTFRIGGMGIFGSIQTCPSRWLMLTGTAAGVLLLGDQMDLSVAQVPLRVTGVVEAGNTTLLDIYFFGGAGGDISLMSMTLTIPQPVPLTSAFIDDDTTLRTSTTTGTVYGGMQLNGDLGPVILSLFGTYGYTGGSYQTTQTSTMSYDYPSASGTIEGRTSMIFGCDILWKRWNTSLSSFVQRDEDGTILNVSLKRLVSSRSRDDSP